MTNSSLPPCRPPSLRVCNHKRMCDKTLSILASQFSACLQSLSNFESPSSLSSLEVDRDSASVNHGWNAKSSFISAPFSSKALRKTAAALDDANKRGISALLQFKAQGGAVNEVAPADTAFVHRNEIATLHYHVSMYRLVATNALT